MSVTIKRVVTAGVVVLFAVALVRAATFRWQEREEAARKECQAELQKAGLTRDQAKAKYPTPSIDFSSACVLPGSTAELVITGKFGPGARFFIENDNIEIVKETSAANQYRATIKAAPGIGPQDATLAAMQPLTGQMTSTGNAIRVGGRFEWTMQTANGWKVVARPEQKEPCPPQSSEATYEVSFYRAGETKPFEQMTGNLHFDMWSATNYNLTLTSRPASGSAMAEYQALMMKMGDRSLTPAQRDKLMKDLEQLSGKLQAEMTKMADPVVAKQRVAEQQAREQNFGCRAIGMKVAAGGSLTGELSCSQKVGTRVAVTGTMAAVK